ncbi:unnamed protein product, partial [Rotaria socialis]
MFQTEALIDTSILPSDIMSLRDVKFFYFVRKEAGDAAVDLFEIQITADNQQSFTCSDTVPDQESSSNAILLNSTSTSITTDDHESVEQPSPLLK